jgi:hypothetical protein
MERSLSPGKRSGSVTSPWWLIFCCIDQMFDLIDGIVSLSHQSSSKLRPAVGRSLYKGAPLKRLHMPPHTGTSHLLIATVRSHISPVGAQLLGHLFVPLMHAGSVTQWL